MLFYKGGKSNYILESDNTLIKNILNSEIINIDEQIIGFILIKKKIY